MPSCSSKRVGRLSFSGTVSMWPAMSARRSRPEVRAGDDGVAVADDLEVRQRRERRLDRVGERPLVAGDRLDVAELTGQVDGGGAEVEGHVADLHPTNLGACLPTCLTTPPRPPHPARRGATASRPSPATAPCSTPGSRSPGSARCRPVATAGSPRPSWRSSPATTRAAPSASTSSRWRSTWMRRPPPRRTPTCACTCSRTCSCSPNRLNLDGIFAHLPIVAWTNAGPVHPADLDRLRPRAAARRHPGGGRRQVPAPARLRDARRASASPTRRASASARTSRPARRSCTKGFVNFNAGHARLVHGRGPDLAGRRGGRRLRHRRRRIHHGHAVGRRHAPRRRSASARCSARTRASASRSATTRSSRPGST